MTSAYTARLRTCRGMTLLEMAVSVAVFAVLVMIAHNAASTSLRSYSTNSTQMGLEENGRRALDSMSAELRRSGIHYHPTQQGNLTFAYPYVWTGNNPNGPYTHLVLGNGETPLDYIDADYPADSSVGANSSMVFRIPVADTTIARGDKDNDGLAWDDMNTPADTSDDVPLPFEWVSGEMEVVWGTGDITQTDQLRGTKGGEIWYTLIRDPGGQYNNLVRREVVGGAVRRETVICNYVERVIFRYYVIGGVQQMSQVELVLHLRRRDDTGEWIRADVSTVVGMRSLKVYP